MALVNCKECGNNISDTAKACPQCGAKPKKPSMVGKLLLALFGFYVLGVIVSGVGDGPKPTVKTDKQEAAEKQNKENLHRASIGALSLRRAMRNPESFNLESAVVVNQTHAVCYEYRAQNGFGGLNVEHAVLASDGMTLKSENMTGFAKLWKKECSAKQGATYTEEIRTVLKYQP